MESGSDIDIDIDIDSDIDIDIDIGSDVEISWLTHSIELINLPEIVDRSIDRSIDWSFNQLIN